MTDQSRFKVEFENNLEELDPHFDLKKAKQRCGVIPNTIASHIHVLDKETNSKKYIIDYALTKDDSRFDEEGNIHENIPDFISLPFEEVQIFLPRDTTCDSMDTLYHLSEDLDKGVINVMCRESIIIMNIQINMELKDTSESFLKVDLNKCKINVMGRWWYFNDFRQFMYIAKGKGNPREGDEMLQELIYNLSARGSDILFFLMDMLSSKDVIFGTSAFKLRGKHNKKVFKVKGFTHLTKKKYMNKRSSITNEVNWSHGFWVAGHWRRTKDNKLGKNRNDEYIVRGMTWVKAHTRKDELGIVEKTRIIN